MYLLGTEVPTYIIFAGIGLIAATIVVSKALLQKMLVRKYIIVVLLSLAGVLIGGKAFGILSVGLKNLDQPWRLLIEESIFHSGIVYYGGLLGYLLFVRVLCKVRNTSFDTLSDILAMGIPLFHCIGRIGCFFAGCCYGIESDSWIAIPYKLYGSNDWTYRIPVQLIEACFEFVLFLVIHSLFYRKEKTVGTEGKLLPLYLICYAVFRLIIEVWRGDELRGVWGSISFSQIISIFLILSLILKKCIGGKTT